MINSINPFMHRKYISLRNANLEYGNYGEDEERSQDREIFNGYLSLSKNRNDLLETAEMISQVKESKLADNKSETKESDAAKTKEKDPFSDAAGAVAKHYISLQFNRSIISDLTKLTPTTVAMTLLGVNFEEDGNALKDGAVSGKGGNYSQAFKGLIKNYDDAIEKAMKEGTWPTIKEGFKTVLGFVPNCGSAIIANSLKYVGSALAKVLDKDMLAALGSGTAVVGKLLNSIGDSVANVLGGTFNGIKSLFKGDTTKAAEAFKNMGKKFKDMGIAIKDKVVEFAKDVKNFVTKTVPQKAKEIWNKFTNWFRRK